MTQPSSVSEASEQFIREGVDHDYIGLYEFQELG